MRSADSNLRSHRRPVVLAAARRGARCGVTTVSSIDILSMSVQTVSSQQTMHVSTAATVPVGIPTATQYE